MTLQGPQPVAVLLCSFKDSPEVHPNQPPFYEDLFANRSTGGLNDYWIAASLGAINLDGTKIFGWKRFDVDRAAFLAAHPKRGDKVNGAIAQFKDVKLDGFVRIVALFDVMLGDGGSTASGILCEPSGVSGTWLAHELGHGFGIEHSFDYSDRQLLYAQKGEYFDRHDIMSAENVNGDTGHRFSARGPLLNTANLDRMGWLPPARVWRPLKNSSSIQDIDIVALSHPEVPGYLAVEAGGWIAEFRMQSGFDGGVPQAAILFHNYPANPNSFIIASDASTYNHDWLPGQVLWNPALFEALGGVKAIVVGFDLAAKKARLRLHFKAVRPPFVDPDIMFGLGIGQLPHDGVILVVRNGKIVPIPVPEPEPRLTLTLDDPALRLGGTAFNRTLELLRRRRS